MMPIIEWNLGNVTLIIFWIFLSNLGHLVHHLSFDSDTPCHPRRRWELRYTILSDLRRLPTRFSQAPYSHEYIFHRSFETLYQSTWRDKSFWYLKEDVLSLFLWSSLVVVLHAAAAEPQRAPSAAAPSAPAPAAAAVLLVVLELVLRRREAAGAALVVEVHGTLKMTQWGRSWSKSFGFKNGLKNCLKNCFRFPIMEKGQKSICHIIKKAWKAVFQVVFQAKTFASRSGHRSTYCATHMWMENRANSMTSQ